MSDVSASDKSTVRSRQQSREEGREPQRVAFSRRGMVATQHHEASRIGAEILRDGGNAIDAAVAAAFALGVCEPAASGLGGQSMLMVHGPRTRRTFALDGSSRAPNRAVPGLLSAEELRRGYRATTVPSTPAVLAYALEHHGTMKLARVLAPCIELAEHGYEVSELQSRLLRRSRKMLLQHGGGTTFLKNGRSVHASGSWLRQPALATTLSTLAKRGVEDFYTGGIARAICADMKSHDGLLHRDDLANIPLPIERRPVAGNFEGHRVMTMPPPGAGRTLLEMLKILTALPKKYGTPDTPEGALVLAEVIRRALIDRNDRPFDPNFYPQMSGRKMLSDDYARQVARQVRGRVLPRGETTHLSVVDSAGHMVGLTQSIERVYGSCAATPELGFLYNDYMAAFEYSDITHPYYLRPNGVPWASVAPSIVFRGRQPWLVIGSPGSERIASSVMQVLVRLLKKVAPFDAVSAARLHCSLHGKVSLEAPRMRTDIPEALERRGFEIDRRDAFSFYMGCVQLVVRDGDGWLGVADPRRDGSAEAPGT